MTSNRHNYIYRLSEDFRQLQIIVDYLAQNSIDIGSYQKLETIVSAIAKSSIQPHNLVFYLNEALQSLVNNQSPETGTQINQKAQFCDYEQRLVKVQNSIVKKEDNVNEKASLEQSKSIKENKDINSHRSKKLLKS